MSTDVNADKSDADAVKEVLTMDTALAGLAAAIVVSAKMGSGQFIEFDQGAEPQECEDAVVSIAEELMRTKNTSATVIRLEELLSFHLVNEGIAIQNLAHPTRPHMQWGDFKIFCDHLFDAANDKALAALSSNQELPSATANVKGNEDDSSSDSLEAFAKDHGADVLKRARALLLGAGRDPLGSRSPFEAGRFQ